MRLHHLPAAILIAGVSLPALASGGGHGFSLKEHGFYIINFLLFFGALGYLLRTPLKNALAKRSDTFKDRLDAASLELEQASKALAQAEENTECLEEEKLAVSQKLQSESARLQQMVEERIVTELKKVKDSSVVALEGEKTRLEKRFTTEVALAALKGAEERLQAASDTLDHKQLVDSFVAGVAGLGSDKGGRP